jgi:aspartyl-tRNA(Asn)/glutamyl-tRNA(Gln) amidotransferase subunit B
LINVEIPLRREENLPVLAPKGRWEVYNAIIDGLMRANKLSSTNAKALLTDVLRTGKYPENMEAYAKDKGYIQVSDEGAISEIVKKVLADNSKAAEDVKNGETKAIGFLVGQVMKESKGQANPELAKQLISKELGV